MNKRREERILTPTEVEGLEREIAEDKPIPEGDEKFYTPEKQNSDETDESIKRYKRVLQQGKPGEVTREDKVLRERQMNLDKEWLQKVMVPRSHVVLRAGPDPEFRKAVNFMAQKEMSKEFQEVAQRYKNNARLLHPDSPELSNLETIRPDKT